MEHHWRTLRRVVDGLERRGNRVVLATATNLRNEVNFELPLIRDGRSYRHLMDYLTPRRQKNIDRVADRLRTEFVRRDADGHRRFLHYVGEHILHDSLYDYARSAVLLRSMLSDESADLALGLDEYTFWVRIMVGEARRLGIPSLVLQEGISDLPPAFSEADRACLWGRTSYNFYRSYGVPADQIVVTGNPRMDLLRGFSDSYRSSISRSVYKKLNVDPKAAMILIPLSMDWEVRTVERTIRWLSDFAEASPHAVAVVKMHPSTHPRKLDTLNEIVSRYLKPKQVRLLHRTSSQSLLIASRAVVLTGITSMHTECLALGVPMISLVAGDGTCPYAEKGVSKPVHGPKQLSRSLNRITAGNERGLTPRAARAAHDLLGDLDGRAAERICDEIDGLIASGPRPADASRRPDALGDLIRFGAAQANGKGAPR
jgi:hypothetical protein